MAKKNLLICFDAFGTLFTPKKPIAQQYGEVARACGLSGFSDEDVAAGFKKAFKQEAAQNPNYGRATGMGAEKWWTNIIHNTFRPYTTLSSPLPPALAPTLLHRFNSKEGYTLYEDVIPLLRRLRGPFPCVGKGEGEGGRVAVGIITNSDDRVPDVLDSLGVRVNPLRFGDDVMTQSLRPDQGGGQNGEKGWDIDFTVLSYDVGYEKPDCRIFNAAESMAEKVSGAQQGAGLEEWRKVYVGDEYDKDVVGAMNAGWNAVLVDRETSQQRREGVEWLDDAPPGPLFDAFAREKAVGFGSLAKLEEWLSARP